MSIIDAAFKQSQTANNTEQAHLAYQQTKQLAFYRKLSIALAGVGLSVTFALAGFYTGQYIQSQSQTADLRIQQENASEMPKAAALQESNSQGNNALSEPVEEEPVTSTQTNQESVQTEEQYQWMSVQVGVDNQGMPIFKQQLVPLSAVANVKQISASTITSASLPENLPANQVQEDLSQYRVLGKPLESEVLLNQPTSSLSNSSVEQEDLSQYRILGKPLATEPATAIDTSIATRMQNENQAQSPVATQSVDEPLDEAAARLKAAFDLAVSETENKNFTQAEPEQPTTEKERLSIEFLPPKTQVAIGKLAYQAHIYSTSEHKRWIKVNGVELYEGDKLNGMRLLEITPEASIFRFQGYDFEVKAMQDWQP